MPKGKKVTEDEYNEVKDLRAAGKSLTSIQIETGRGWGTIYEILNTEDYTSFVGRYSFGHGSLKSRKKSMSKRREELIEQAKPITSMEEHIVDASKVTIDPLKVNAPLSMKRKRELRLEAVKAYIESKPYGTRIKASEFRQVMNAGTEANAYNIIKLMIRDGLIFQWNIGPKSFFYTVPTEVKTTKLAEYEVESGVPAPGQVDDIDEAAVAKIMAEKRTAVDVDLEQLAMKFGWEHPLYNNDLREFVKWASRQ